MEEQELTRYTAFLGGASSVSANSVASSRRTGKSHLFASDDDDDDDDKDDEKEEDDDGDGDGDSDRDDDQDLEREKTMEMTTNSMNTGHDSHSHSHNRSHSHQYPNDSDTMDLKSKVSKSQTTQPPAQIVDARPSLGSASMPMAIDSSTDTDNEAIVDTDNDAVVETDKDALGIDADRNPSIIIPRTTPSVGVTTPARKFEEPDDPSLASLVRIDRIVVSNDNISLYAPTFALDAADPG